MINVLVLEDNIYDAELMIRTLIKYGLEVRSDRVDTRDDFFRSVTEQSWDVILADFSLPSFDAPAAMKIMREIHNLTPIIIVTGSIGESAAVSLIRNGAADYVLKDHLDTLPLAVIGTLSRK